MRFRSSDSRCFSDSFCFIDDVTDLGFAHLFRMRLLDGGQSEIAQRGRMPAAVADHLLQIMLVLPYLLYPVPEIDPMLPEIRVHSIDLWQDRLADPILEVELHPD